MPRAEEPRPLVKEAGGVSLGMSAVPTLVGSGDRGGVRGHGTEAHLLRRNRHSISFIKWKTSEIGIAGSSSLSVCKRSWRCTFARKLSSAAARAGSELARWRRLTPLIPLLALLPRPSSTTVRSRPPPVSWLGSRGTGPFGVTFSHKVWEVSATSSWDSRRRSEIISLSSSIWSEFIEDMLRLDRPCSSGKLATCGGGGGSSLYQRSSFGLPEAATIPCSSKAASSCRARSAARLSRSNKLAAAGRRSIKELTNAVPPDWDHGCGPPAESGPGSAGELGSLAPLLRLLRLAVDGASIRLIWSMQSATAVAQNNFGFKENCSRAWDRTTGVISPAPQSASKISNICNKTGGGLS
mmetsp:Transcript_55901/g.148974  ORF Transcript_55901/g.148974 Transcript_55901/m.148974 type:complete len:353 (-) Transcript_55901:1441-2499(-)